MVDSVSVMRLFAGNRRGAARPRRACRAGFCCGGVGRPGGTMALCRSVDSLDGTDCDSLRPRAGFDDRTRRTRPGLTLHHPARPSANPTCQRMARQWFRWAGIMSTRDSVCARKAFVCAIAEPRRSIVKQLLHLFSQKLPTEPADPRQGFLLFLIVLLCGNTRRTSA